MRALVDSDVLIWHLRGEQRALAFLKRLRNSEGYELWTGAMQRAEVIFHMRRGEEKGTLLFLSLFKTAPVDQPVVDRAGALYRTFHPTHGVDANDSLLAATALVGGGTVFTLNMKHYPFPGLLVERAFETE